MENNNVPSFGLIGHPISHSLSPGLFKAAYHGKFAYDLIENQNFETAYNIFLVSYSGINVTAPFKEQAFLYADIPSEECQIIGAANILVKRQGKIHAYNSDYQAVKSILKECGTGNSNILVLGCGGAGKAAIAASAQTGADTIVINRTTVKATEWLKRKKPMENVSVEPMEMLDVCIREADIIINSLPCHLTELDRLAAKGSLDELLRGKTVIEANYRNPQFRTIIERNGLQVKYISGHKWLLEQAASGYFELTCTKPDYTSMCQYLSEFNLAGFKIND